METHVERNAVICKLYTENGLTLQAISDMYSISRERVRQILRKNNVFRAGRAVKLTGRDTFLGVEITDTAKEALRMEADKCGESMSSLGAQAVDDLLAKRGYTVGE